MRIIVVGLLVLATCAANDFAPYGSWWAIGAGVGLAFGIGELFGQRESR